METDGKVAKSLISKGLLSLKPALPKGRNPMQFYKRDKSDDASYGGRKKRKQIFKRIWKEHCAEKGKVAQKVHGHTRKNGKRVHSYKRCIRKAE
jgi:hypothetical protein